MTAGAISNWFGGIYKDQSFGNFFAQFAVDGPFFDIYPEFIVKPDAMEVLPTLVEHYGEPLVTGESTCTLTSNCPKEDCAVVRTSWVFATRGPGFRRALVNHYMSAASLLPWRHQDGPSMAMQD